MKIREAFYFSIWMTVPLIMILSLILTGCSPAVIAESEIILEKVIEEELEEDLKGK